MAFNIVAAKARWEWHHLEEGDDVIEELFVARNHDNLLFFTNLGRVYNMQVFEVPEGSRIAKGRAIVNLLPLTPGEHVVKLLCARDLVEGNLYCIAHQKWHYQTY